MADYVIDTFSDTTDTVLSSHTPDTGGAWTRTVGTTATIKCNASARAEATGDELVIYANASSFSSKEQQVVAVPYMTSESLTKIGVLLRSHTNDYAFSMYFENYPIHQVSVGLHTMTALFGPYACTSGDTCKLTAEAEGVNEYSQERTRLKLYINGNLQESYLFGSSGCDAYANIGKPGIAGRVQYANPSVQIASATWSDVSAGTVIPIAALSANLRMQQGQ